MHLYKIFGLFCLLLINTMNSVSFLGLNELWTECNLILKFSVRNKMAYPQNWFTLTHTLIRNIGPRPKYSVFEDHILHG